jgi:hypothetical protein
MIMISQYKYKTEKPNTKTKAKENQAAWRIAHGACLVSDV